MRRIDREEKELQDLHGRLEKYETTQYNRPCLRCKKKFKTYKKFMRLCATCKNSDSFKVDSESPFER